MTPAISCIIPAHNGERFLAATIESLLAQTWTDLEVVVVDDGSTDRTVEIATAYGPRVRCSSHPVAHPVRARNHGIAIARGAFLAFLDHDDLSAADRFEVQMAAFERDPALDVCVGMVQRFTQSAPGAALALVGPAVPGYLTVAMLARRQVFASVGPLDPAQLHADSAEWFLRARAAGIRISLVPDVVTFHRDHDANLSLVDGDGSRAEFMRLIKAKLDRERRG